MTQYFSSGRPVRCACNARFGDVGASQEVKVVPASSGSTFNVAMRVKCGRCKRYSDLFSSTC